MVLGGAGFENVFDVADAWWVYPPCNPSKSGEMVPPAVAGWRQYLDAIAGRKGFEGEGKGVKGLARAGHAGPPVPGRRGRSQTGRASVLGTWQCEAGMCCWLSLIRSS